MFRNLFKVTLRKILSDKVYTLLNVVGLTIGITSSLFLFIYVMDELSFDRYHQNAENIYRVVSHMKEPKNAFTWPVTQPLLAEELKNNHPQVRNTVRFFPVPPLSYKHAEKEFVGERFFKADSTIFSVFTYRFLAGDPATSLDNPSSIVLTEKIAKKYFPDPQAALGQSLENANGEVFKITGVIENVPLSSHFLFDALISNTAYGVGDWGSFGVYTYALIPKEGVSTLSSALFTISKEKVAPVLGPYGMELTYELQKITDIHLRSKIPHEAESSGDISYVYIFGATSVILLLIACINYINLVTARSITRAKEVGIRKALGSQKKLIMIQSLFETCIVAFVALVISLILLYLLLPSFNTLANKQFTIGIIFSPLVIIALLTIVLFIGVVGGSYPAFYLSNFNPVIILKGKLKIGGKGHLFRKVLVAGQFVISIFMLISTLIVSDQLKFMKSKPLGFNHDGIVRLSLDGNGLFQNGLTFIEKLSQVSNIQTVASAETSPGKRVGKPVFSVEDNEGAFSDKTINFYHADYDFIDAMEMKILKGRNFSREVTTDTDIAVLVNESMVKLMSWTDPLGKKIISKGGGQGASDLVRVVVGVIEDYHHSSLHNEIEPLVIAFAKRNTFIFAKFSGDPKSALGAIEGTWREVFADAAFNYQFLDQDFDLQYKADDKRGDIFTIFSLLSIVITCLGVLGLTAFTTEQRTKEIGVRKVVGASIESLVMLVSKEFMFLVAIASAIALPLAWYSAGKWLQNFAYKIKLSDEWLTLVLSIALIFVVVLSTTLYHIFRAASANPVKALRAQD